MADNKIKVRHVQRHDTESNWSSKNPVLLDGELAFTTDGTNAGKYKLGDGTSKWSTLSYAKARLEKDDVITALGYTPSATNHTHAGSATQPVYFKDGKPTACTYTLGKSVPSNAIFTDTNTKVTSVDNHYTPSGGTTLSASGGTVMDIMGSDGVQVITGITKDAAGHVTGITSKALQAIQTPIPGATTSAAGLMTSTDKKMLSILSSPIATCATGRANAAKVATLSNFTLSVGMTIAVKFTDTAGTANPTSGNLTLNINSTGAKTIGFFRNGSKGALTYSSGAYFYNNLTHIFTYDGTYWLCMDWNADNNTTYSVASTSSNGLMSKTDKKKLNGMTLMSVTDFEALFK